MATIKSFKNRLANLDVVAAVGKSMEATTVPLVEINREQMLEGKRRDGRDITPSYLEDPFFKSREAAQRYSDWKDDITPHPKRKKGVPNLFIVGTYHNSIEALIRGEVVQFNASFVDAADIERKFGHEIYGLNAEKRVGYLRDFLRPELLKNVRLSLHL